MAETWLKRYLVACHVYGGGLAVWLVVRPFVAESSAVVFAINSLLLLAFLPVPLLLLSSLLLRQWSLLALGGVLSAAWCWLYGALFWPHAEPLNHRPPLSVLAFNALGLNHDAQSTVDLVRASKADVVALQELNPETATALEQQLGELYPYRWLEPRVGVTGGGLLSKEPFTRSREQLAGDWVDPPMVVDLDVPRGPITLVRFHATSHPRHWREREEQARILAERAALLRARFILVGDLNATEHNTAYALIAERASDAWREAGWGFGHTFPGTPTPSRGGARPSLLGLPSPRWLVRIDYVFHSRDIATVAANVIGDGQHSDHRGVLATLAL